MRSGHKSSGRLEPDIVNVITYQPGRSRLEYHRRSSWLAGSDAGELKKGVTDNGKL
jgi:hypothetical protein